MPHAIIAAMIKKIKQVFQKKRGPNIIPREKHPISRKDINGYALKVMRKLNEANFDAYLVGGCVRDILLGKHPKDFDVVTNAKPNEVKRLFRNCYLIGKRFRLAHIRFGREIIEVATYRSAKDEEESGNLHHGEHGMILRDNVFGTVEEDAYRRDFTINALYYNFADSSIVDYVGGMVDIKAKIIRLIGEPEKRFREDPLRMVRAIRFKAKLSCELEESIIEGIHKHRSLLKHIPTARLFDEIMKIYRSGHAKETFQCLQEYYLLQSLFPQVLKSFEIKNADLAKRFVKLALSNTDLRVQEGKHLSPAFLFAALLWWPLQKKLNEFEHKGEKLFVALNHAMNAVLSKQLKYVAIPKRFTTMMREIWFLQYQLPLRRAKRIYRCYYHPRFRAAYDFLVLRAEAGEDVKELADWWTEFQHVDELERAKMIKPLQDKSKSKKSKLLDDKLENNSVKQILR